MRNTVLCCCLVITLQLFSVRGALFPSLKRPTLKSPWFCHDLDCPEFTVEEEDVAQDIELRSYPAAQWVSTNVTDARYDEASRSGFLKLYKYISGDNEGGKQIAMTAPVKVHVIPGASPEIKDQYKVSFFVPMSLQGSAPKPNDAEVYLVNTHVSKYFVYSYPGFTYESKVMDKLYTALEEMNKTDYQYDASNFYTASYDSPIRLINRHNEVWIPAV
ncbi:hypothetical protein CEUSTIGMA_g10225.t1 [Chlamydomonas eustigma]|uniref:Heme-binding protein 2 n=1 Tax=Chlamydomonas eustigma TaxID=1157962 RepID=A0A250XIQ4_9CHLO|nr:hypothetical protein CEUSTIGMA_g10225.t1 [Chlamydomonas eustigma]|eukprot:GAX82799.1 hypothetical protein CEUSTIGMA_g10225.t1 [Chlamydomonas eustigma]